MNPLLRLIGPWIPVLSMVAGVISASLFWRAEIATLERNHAQAQALAEAAARKQLEDAQARGDALSLRLAQSESKIQHTTLEVIRELPRVTTGRACLGADAVGVLNAGHAADAVPEAAGTPAATDAAVATDSDVAGWIAVAWGAYDTCRERLDALIDFNLAQPVREE